MLLHYSQRLLDLKNHDDIRKGNSIVKRDLDENSKHAKEISETIPDDYSYLINTENGKIICLAAKCYTNDLKQSQKTARELLGKINTEFSNVQNEIVLADKIKSIIGCNGISFVE